MDEISFREAYGLWWPSVEGSEEKLFNYMLNRVTDVDLALKHCRTKGLAVQAGGFIGMWPQRLAKFFERVHTFEPMPTHFECVKRNTAHLPGVRVYNAALGPTCGEIRIAPKRGGCTFVTEDGQLPVQQVTIDSLNLPRCDAIFLDLERYELPALEGATKTLKAFSPVITVEFKADTVKDLHKWMKDRRYEQVEQVHGDMIFARNK
jgi:FkbM family methyltransferase